VNVSGLSILTRKMLVMRRFGGDAWGQFFRDVAGTHRCFRALVTADTLVPLPAFLAFHDELMRRFFKQDADSYLKLGREASRWAVRDGPLKTLLAGSDLESVVTSLPKFHSAYFKETSTWSEAAITSEGVEFKVFDLPESHPYFEHFVVGYIAEILEMYCANPIRAVRLEGGGKQYHYLLHGAPTNDASDFTPNVEPGHASAGVKVAHQLSNRELEVLLLVARGRTNEEIGAVLGISRKTAQHHVASAYRKIGVSSRVGAAIWLAERGLVGN
jgi:DNA-binding CsgD family transcriptional regulator